MEIFFHLNEANMAQKIILALGNFDGVHIGHQCLLREVVKWAGVSGAKPAVLLFKPHPLEVLKPQQSFRYISSFNDKLRHIAATGIQCCFCVDFDQKLAQMTAEQFLQSYIWRFSGLQGVVVGYNYTFGFQGQGTAFYLQQQLASQIQVKIIPPVKINAQVVSSSQVRQLLSTGDVVEAAKNLGYAPFIRGRVIHGDERGRRLGFPTINVFPAERYILPGHGVYAAKVRWGQHTCWGAADVGVRPTFGQGLAERLEIHLLDFSGNLYAAEVEVSFHSFIRKECKFATTGDLLERITADVAAIRQLAAQGKNAEPAAHQEILS